MIFTPVQRPETKTVNDCVVEAFTVAVLVLSALLSLITIASA
jgi:hypothetical protein